MRCRTVRRKLTVYRELDAAERERLQQHLDRCPRCAEAFAAYRAMDGMLSALLAIEPSPRLAATVRACIARSRPTPALVVPRWAYSFLAVLLAFALTLGGTLNASAGALPGDLLYPVKRIAEQAQMALRFAPASRDAYQEHLEETRREEVRKLLELERQEQVEFQGQVQAIKGNTWIVDGLEVSVPPEAAAAEAPEIGAVVRVSGRTADGQGVVAQAVRVEEPEPSPTPAPTAQEQPHQEEVAPVRTPRLVRSAVVPSPRVTPIGPQLGPLTTGRPPVAVTPTRGLLKPTLRRRATIRERATIRVRTVRATALVPVLTRRLITRLPTRTRWRAIERPTATPSRPIAARTRTRRAPAVRPTAALTRTRRTPVRPTALWPTRRPTATRRPIVRPTFTPRPILPRPMATPRQPVVRPTATPRRPTPRPPTPRPPTATRPLPSATPQQPTAVVITRVVVVTRPPTPTPPVNDRTYAVGGDPPGLTTE